MQVLDTNLPVHDVNEDNLEHDAPPREPQEPQQPGAVTATQELDGQQPEVASPLQEPPGEQAEAAGANGKWKPVFSGQIVKAWKLYGVRNWKWGSASCLLMNRLLKWCLDSSSAL